MLNDKPHPATEEEEVQHITHECSEIIQTGLHKPFI
jgi:hypothetical protein